MALSVVAARSAVGAPDRITAPDISLTSLLAGSRPAAAYRTLKNSRDVRALGDRLEKVVAAVTPSVVAVGAGGSGVVVTPDGFVLCVAHVGLRAGRAMTFTFPDGRRASGVTLGNCTDVDAALMKITDPGPWPHVDMGRSAEVKPGDWVLALSYPTTFEHGRPPVVRTGRVLRPEPFSIVTDCTIMGGDSGGPLFDLDGRVIAISSTCNDSLLENRHVPVDRFREEWERLAKSEDFYGRPDLSELLGLRRDPKATTARLGPIAADSPAGEAGLKAGDVVLRFDGQPVHAYDDLRPLAARHHPGCTCDIVIEVKRGDEVLKFHTTFAKTGKPAMVAPVSLDSEKSGPADRDAVRKMIAGSSAATVRILSGGSPIALGTVVDADGYVVTKASLLHGDLVVRLHDGRELAAGIVGKDTVNDLALLHANARGLRAIEWRKGPAPPPGSIVAAAGATDEPLGIGVVSTEARRIRGSTVPPDHQGWLGVSLSEDAAGVLVDSVVHRSPAERAGLAPGDQIVSINSKPMGSTNQVTETVRNAGPDAALGFTIRRRGEPRDVAVTLGRPPGTTGRAPEDNWGGGPFSERRWGFPSVIPHDIAVLPQDCGGPLVDSDGKVVGVNIARALRVSTFALPADTVRRLVHDLMVAPNNTNHGATESTERK